MVDPIFLRGWAESLPLFPLVAKVIAGTQMTSRYRSISWLLLIPAVWLCGCASSGRVWHRPDAVKLPCDQICTRKIYLIRHGWHTSLAVKRCEIFVGDWPESTAIQDGNFIEVGWGDEDYLCSRFLNPLVMVKAGCLPSRSAIHVAGFHQPPEVFFENSQIIEIDVPAEKMRKLCRYIQQCYARDRHGCPIKLGPSIYGVGGIYRANGHYYLPKTCNIWTANALAAADIPLVVPLCTFAQPLVCQSKSFGREVNKRSTVLPVMYPFFNFDRPRNR